MQSSFLYNGISVVPPTGSIIAYLGTTDPSGWVLMDGVTRTNTNGMYNGLLNMGIGTGTLNVNYTPPNYSAAFLRGLGTNGNYQSGALGRQTANAQADGVLNHTHAVSFFSGQQTPFSSPTKDYLIGSGPDGTNTGGVIGGIAENRVYNFAVNWILKL